MHVRLSSHAEQQIAEAAAHHESLEKGLGPRFIDSVHEAIEDIGRFPEAYRRMRGTTRRIMLRTFPWGLFYHRLPDCILVTSLIHLHSDPKSWEQYYD